ncbi:leucine--tRNA ligase [Rubrobacter radiotolerans]|uniref:Leucine--tRNA ligase n=1 Tax=Rubrobacter radiotolerans TaxID=42256 RepID=A0A023X7M3_RUBRA|nr:leucine--tRNA ligase [Rubrobacter radiotolerans]AHY48044.1 leucine--tRNA ligase [Rubrobacter radiotolerans]MDX5892683.1 leucine--tRNA ligase [Rubrobacter radiotolerans]SMC08112.1 leucyl-tRNA synthetase [Rubrobacter radiotolerans DSM 5868]
MTDTRAREDHGTFEYDPTALERRWRERWEEAGLYKTDEDESKPKHYALTMLPYPSGDLHVGHWYPMTPSDSHARFMRMNGYRVFFPIGFDAFGLPAENAAIKRGIHPRDWTYSNIENMRGQLRQMGAMFDLDAEVVTCDPEYYRWNQWFFIEFFKRGLAYRKQAPVDWCPNDNTTLAREQVIGPERVCERCGTPVVKKNLWQWLFRITDYADELLDFSKLDWPERVETLQRNWIGRSEGAEIRFAVPGYGDIEVFTTRPDTLFGATFFVMSPEHPAVDDITTDEQRAAVEAYKEHASRMSEIDRTDATREKTGVFTGAYATNPANGKPIPIYLADYVLMGYGTGAIMAVPGQDERDWEFAEKYDLPIVRTVKPPEDFDGKAYTGDGPAMNSGFLDGLGVEEAKAEMIRHLEETGRGGPTVTYRLRDWLISRQRYWGTPIPMIHCGECGTVPVPEEDLPVLLPEDAEFTPTGESPLKLREDFWRVECPQCGGPAERETDTMDTFMDSSWYQYRYLSPHYDEGPFDPERGRKWLPVDLYTGGVEHATMHLLYTRFFTKVMRDMGLVDFDEPMKRLFNQGTILGPDGQKMSKSRGNVVNPQEYVDRYGSDALRCYLMFIGPWNEGGPWDGGGFGGVSRWLRRAVSLASDAEGSTAEADPQEIGRRTNRLVKKVTEDVRDFRFNTAIAALMEHVNYLLAVKGRVAGEEWTEALKTFTLVLAPIAPHHAEQLWHDLGEKDSVHLQSWPGWDEAEISSETVTLIVQVNGKLRDRIEAPADLDEEGAKRLALGSSKVAAHTDGKTLRKTVYVPGRLVNLVVG